MKIAICDKIGLCYDGTTLEKHGLGGSESAVILMSKELQQLGFNVTVFNNCNDSTHSSEGTYNGVRYIDNSNATNHNEEYDIVIVSRTAEPFLNKNRYPFLKSAKMKALWLHDTFCEGDQHVQNLVLSGEIDYIFTLSDFHTDYVLNCDHGQKRNYEVLKHKVFQTRNGAVKYIDEVDLTKKDINHFVYNSSVTKGLIPLLEHIWPEVKKQIPQAHLTVIGGYYRFREGAEPDAQEKTLRKLVEDERLKELGITFTDVIPQPTIAEILANATFMIYPGSFPETFGISAMESLLYNTPLITTNFGALEETAVTGACYTIDFAIEPNSLFPYINKETQIKRFVQMTVDAYNNPYLLQQKQNYCSVVHDVAGWDSVAIEWKRFFHHKLGKFLPAEDYRVAKIISQKVNRVFGRVNNMPNYREYISFGKQRGILIVSPFYNCEKYISNCILSVAQQDYDNYVHVLIDDCSTDNSFEVARQTIDSLPPEVRSKFSLQKNLTNRGAVYNQITAIDIHGEDDDIVMLLDGDDWLVNNNTLFHLYNDYYNYGTEFTYGSCWSLVDNIPLVAQDYPESVKQNRSYREHKFNWNMPYTHLRTFRKSLINSIDQSEFKDENGEWYRAGGDGSIFYSLIERANPENIIALKEIVYAYNDINPINDYKINGDEQSRNAAKILTKNSGVKLSEHLGKQSEKNAIKEQTIKKETHMQRKKRILIAIPTSKYIEPETFKSLYDLDIPEGYETEFQFFYGYSISQIRNLIAEWAKHYDYLFSVDSDIVLPKNTLRNFIAADKDIISGLYIQRIPNTHTLEIYMDTPNGGCTNMPYELIKNRGIVEIAGCGFGCVLIKSEVFRTIPYPHFEYHSAINHRDTISEDIDFAIKARKHGFKLWADSSIHCEHIGNTKFIVDQPPSKEISSISDEKKSLKALSNKRLLPKTHVDYLNEMSIEPKVIYDIGSCVTHWCSVAKEKWNNSNFFLFEAMDDVEEIYQEKGFPNYNIGVLSDKDDRIIEFYENKIHPGGNSYYRENPKHSNDANILFGKDKIVKKKTSTLDTVVEKRNWPLPDFIKIDVQGSELDILKGATKCLSNCKDVIVELQHVEYNIGAPNKDNVIEYMKQSGFELISNFSNTNVDGDFHFRKIND